MAYRRRRVTYRRRRRTTTTYTPRKRRRQTTTRRTQSKPCACPGELSPGAKWALAQLDPFDNRCFGAKVPDSNTVPSIANADTEQYLRCLRLEVACHRLECSKVNSKMTRSPTCRRPA